MISRFSTWINSVNTTSLRIIASIGGAMFVVTTVLLAMVIRNWEPTAMQYKILIGIAGVLMTMQGFDVIQFWTKRSTDAGYQAAKSGASAGSSVDVSPAPPAPQVQVTGTGAPIADTTVDKA